MLVRKDDVLCYKRFWRTVWCIDYPGFIPAKLDKNSFESVAPPFSFRVERNGNIVTGDEVITIDSITEYIPDMKPFKRYLKTKYRGDLEQVFKKLVKYKDFVRGPLIRYENGVFVGQYGYIYDDKFYEDSMSVFLGVKDGFVYGRYIPSKYDNFFLVNLNGENMKTIKGISMRC